MTDMRLRDKVAIVTGATKGIGAGIARRFAEEGAAVVVAGRTEALGNAVAEEIRAEGGRAIFIRSDISVEDDCRRLVELTQAEFGPLTTLVNNAAATHLYGSSGKYADTRMHLLSNEVLDQAWRSDLYGLFWCCRYALLAMLEADAGGAIVNVSSGVAVRGAPDLDAYTAAKAAMNGITRSMASEYAAARIRVNVISTGFIHSGEGTEHLLSGEMEAALRAITPLPYFGVPDDIAWAAVYLASDESRYVTGVTLPVDGGSVSANVGGPTEQPSAAQS
ncbi:MAG: short-chain dehydrogenase/reductase [Actinomycetia bacterium]|nr:short-chain dehydrogenase/reductase [Actinomycetes bacterium]